MTFAFLVIGVWCLAIEIVAHWLPGRFFTVSQLGEFVVEGLRPRRPRAWTPRAELDERIFVRQMRGLGEWKLLRDLGHIDEDVPLPPLDDWKPPKKHSDYTYWTELLATGMRESGMLQQKPRPHMRPGLQNALHVMGQGRIQAGDAPTLDDGKVHGVQTATDVYKLHQSGAIDRETAYDMIQRLEYRRRPAASTGSLGAAIGGSLGGLFGFHRH